MRHPSKFGRGHALLGVSILGLGLAGVAQAGVTQPKASATVRVTITDRTLRVTPANPESGATTFIVFNKGKKRHFFSISGPRLKGVKTGKIAPGKSMELTVRLRPGAYVLSDPVGLGTYTSAFLHVIRATVLGGQGNANKVQPEVEPPPMCGVYFTP